MKQVTSNRWWADYCRWGGQSFLIDPAGWGNGNWRYAWFREKITADEFIERFMSSVRISAPSSNYHNMTDIEEYFVVVCHEEEY